MTQETALLATLAGALSLALVLGWLAVRLGLSALVGYLVAGILIGPFTPGYVADTGLAAQLAEVGVILLMLGVGMHFSVRDLLAVRRIVVPGALLRMLLITVLGAAIARAWSWTWGAGIVYGLALSIASTVVLLRAFDDRNATTSLEGHVAIGWLVVEDLATVFVLVLLPAIAGPLGGGMTGGAPGPVVAAVAVTLLKVAAFVALMLLVGSRLVPRLLASVAHTGSRELFTLSVLAVALGVAFGAARLFGVSFALGAFFAGVVIAESDMSHQAAADALPLQDAFAVLFFVSVGMVFDPRILVRDPGAVVASFAVATLGKAVVTFAILSRAGVPLRSALTASVGLSQVGEFSFIIAGVGVSIGVLSHDAQSLVLATAILSITANPIAFKLVGRADRWLRERPRLLSGIVGRARDHAERVVGADALGPQSIRNHVVIVGFGRVGSLIGRALERQGIPFLVVESDRQLVERLRRRGLHVLFGDASRRAVLEHARLDQARLLVIATPGTYQTRAILDIAGHLNPTLDSVVRTHSETEQSHLEGRGVGAAVVGERELAVGMARYALRRCGTDATEADQLLMSLDTRTDGAAPAGHG